MTLVTDYGDIPLLGGEATLSLTDSVGNSVQVAYGEANLKIDRVSVSASRSGKWSDFKRPGKLNVSGTISRLLVDGELWNELMGLDGSGKIGRGKTFDMVVSGSGANLNFVATLNNCFFTSGEIVCGSSDTFIEEPHDFEMQNAAKDFKLVIV